MSINIVKEFKKYTNKFEYADEINRKVKHSIRVMKLASKISKKMKLKKEEIKLAKIIGLLHDYARFPQWEKYKTFEDFKSVDHGDLGAKLLIDDLKIKKFSENINDYEIIRYAIMNHNKKIYDHNLSKRALLHCDIIRDIDKLDIFYIYAKGILCINTTKEEINKNIEKEFYNNNIICKKDVKNDNESLLLLLSMIYDINFLESIRYLNKKNYLWIIYEKLENKEYFIKYFKYVDNYVKERLK